MAPSPSSSSLSTRSMYGEAQASCLLRWIWLLRSRGARQRVIPLIVERQARRARWSRIKRRRASELNVQWGNAGGGSHIVVGHALSWIDSEDDNESKACADRAEADTVWVPHMQEGVSIEPSAQGIPREQRVQRQGWMLHANSISHSASFYVAAIAGGRRGPGSGQP
jgi:hypothetical protein